MRVSIHTLFSTLLFNTSWSNAKSTKHLVYQYEPITWVENVAVRSNGKVLSITTTSAVLNELDPTKTRA